MTSVPVGPASRARTQATAVPLPPVRRRRLTAANAGALLRWTRLKCRYRRRVGGLFYLGGGSWVEIGARGRLRTGPRTRFLGRLTLSVHGEVRIGTECHFSRDCQLSSMESITIGDNCGFAEGTAIHDMVHCYGPEWARTRFWDRPFWTAPIVIGSNVWAGAKVTIGGGVTIGDDVVIAAHSVVVSDVPSHCLVAGAPARVVRSWAAEVVPAGSR